MADTRYFVYVTEPDEHYTTQSAAETAATELSEADQDSTYLVRGAVIETIANVSAAGVVTTTPVPDARWDNHHVGWHFDETTGTRAPVSLGNPNCTNSLVETGAATGYASGKFSNAARLACCPAQTLTANSLDFRLSTRTLRGEGEEVVRRSSPLWTIATLLIGGCSTQPAPRSLSSSTLHRGV